MNLRESGALSARRISTTIGVVGAALASIIGISVWAGTSANAANGSTSTQNNQQQDDGQQNDGQQNGSGTQNGFVAPGNGGGSNGFSRGS